MQKAEAFGGTGALPQLTPPVPMRATPRWLIRVVLLGVAPVLLTMLTMRFLIPGRAHLGPGLAGWLAQIGQDHALPLALALFFLFALLIRHFADRRALGLDVEPLAATHTQAWVQLGSIVVLAATAALAVRTTIGQPYRVTSESMLPTVAPGDHVAVNKLAYGLRLPGTRKAWGAQVPRRGDVVTFDARAVGERHSEDVLIKRVVGLPGDFVQMRGGVVTINGWQAPLCEVGPYVFLSAGDPVIGRLYLEYLDDRAHLTLHTGEGRRVFEGHRVRPGEVFVVGDNRNMSRDSRSWQHGKQVPGAGVPLGAITGRSAAVFRRDRDGHVALGQLGRNANLSVYLPGIDTRALQAKVGACLKSWPQQTSPPQPAR